MVIRIYILLFFVLVLDLQRINCQETHKLSHSFSWDVKSIKNSPYSEQEMVTDFCDGMVFEKWQGQYLPTKKFIIPTRLPGQIILNNVSEEWEPTSNFLTSQFASIDHVLQIDQQMISSSGNHFINLAIVPFRKNGNKIERLKNWSADIEILPIYSANRRRKSNQSILSKGEIFKVSVSSKGIYKLDFNYFKNTLKLDPTKIDPRKIHLLGNGGGLLPENNQLEYADDPTENPVLFFGDQDGRFDEGDFMMFYSDGPDKVLVDTLKGEFVYQKNIYSNKAGYFIQIDDKPGLRVENKANIAGNTVFDDKYDSYAHFEEDKVNLISTTVLNSGSGKMWFGDLFRSTREKDYSDKFNILDVDITKQGKAWFSFASRAPFSAQSFLDIENSRISNQHFTVDLSTQEGYFANLRTNSVAFLPNSDKLKVVVRYPEQAQTSDGWLDWIGVQLKRNMVYQSQPLYITNFNSLSAETYGLRLRRNGKMTTPIILDITDPLRPSLQSADMDNDNIWWSFDSQNLRQFVAFDRNGIYPNPAFEGNVPNQNLHGLSDIDMVILYHPDFTTQASRLMQFKTAQGLNTTMISIGNVYNEFSSGFQDITAIRNFNKHIKQQSPDYRFLILFGDASYDLRRINQSISDQNFIPTYETWESLEQLSAYPTDDYFGLLDPNESGLNGGLDIAIGRLPVRNETEAENLVNKIIKYESDPSSFGDWRTRTLFIADDEDSNLHCSQCNRLADNTRQQQNNLNFNKIFLDAYKQENTPGGERYPTVKTAINNEIYKGMLVMTYFGHGGNLGLAQERILEVNDILSWRNEERLPLFVTATCTFGAFDNAASTSPAEYILHNQKGGGIALFTTVRPVYAGDNESLNVEVFRSLIPNISSSERRPYIGEVLIRAKNLSGASNENNRKFTLLGDPSLRLAFPQENVVITNFQNHPVDSARKDTLNALSKVKFEGEVRNKANLLIGDFNGKVNITLYDKAQNLRTLGQDPGSTPLGYKLQNNILFKGSASVTNGKFQIEFYIPKDINYVLGPGKISLYAHDFQTRDAIGTYESFLIGGTDTTSKIVSSPLVNPYMNNYEFVSGGTTDKNPLLLVKLKDEIGINVSGNAIGHDLEATLDNNSQTFILNDFYESKIDTYKEGEVKFPLSNLSEGKHTLKITAWNVGNRKTEASIDFVVSNGQNIAINHLLNYPNPFFNSTKFQFEHNQPNLMLDYTIQLYNIGGRLIKTISDKVISDGYIVNDISWNGKDEFGDKLANGVYLYRLRISCRSFEGKDLSYTSDLQKLVILN